MYHVQKYLIAIVVFCNFTLVPHPSLAAQPSNYKVHELRIAKLKQFKAQLGANNSLEAFTRKFEHHFLTPRTWSADRFLNENNRKKPVDFFVYKNKIKITAGKKIAFLELINDETLTLNGVSLSQEDFRNSQTLMARIVKILNRQSSTSKYSALDIILRNIIPQAEATDGYDLGLAAIGGVAFAVAAFFISKIFKKTSHDINVNGSVKADGNLKLDNSTQTLKVEGGTNHTVNANADLNATATGLVGLTKNTSDLISGSR